MEKAKAEFGLKTWIFGNFVLIEDEVSRYFAVLDEVDKVESYDDYDDFRSQIITFKDYEMLNDVVYAAQRELNTSSVTFGF